MTTIEAVSPGATAAPQEISQVALDRAEVQQATAAVSTAVAREDADISTGDKVLAALDGAVVAEAQGEEQATLDKFDGDQGSLAVASQAAAQPAQEPVVIPTVQGQEHVLSVEA